MNGRGPLESSVAMVDQSVAIDATGGMIADTSSIAASAAASADVSFPSASFHETSFHWRNLFQSPRMRNVDLNPSETREVQSEVTVTLFHAFLQRHYTLILLGIGLVLWPLGYHSFVQFQSSTDATFRPVVGSLSGLAQEAFGRAYHHDFMDPMHPPLFLALIATNASSDDSNGTDNATDTNHGIESSRHALSIPGTPEYQQAHAFGQGLVPFLHAQCWTWSSQHRAPCRNETDWWRVSSYYSVVDQNLSSLARSTLMIPSGAATLVSIEYTLPAAQRSHHKWRVGQLMHAMDDYQHFFWNESTGEQRYFTVNTTGIQYFSSDLARSTRRDIQRMDVLVLPCALILLGLVLPTASPWVIWIVPVVTMMTTVALWSWVMLYLVVPSWQISTFTPTIMMSLTLGLGIDYTLFLLSRYLEEMNRSATAAADRRSTAMATMLSHSGHVVALSGVTLATAFVGLWILPLGMLQSIGLGAATAIVSSVVVNLVTVPVLLYTPLGLWIVHTNSNDENHAVALNPMIQPLLEDESPTDDLDPIGRIGDHLHRRLAMSSQSLPRKSIWFRLSKHLLHPYKGVIILLVALQLLTPIMEQVRYLQSSISFDLLLPSKSPSLQTYHFLGSQMGLGSLNPYRILIDGRAANLTMTSDVGFYVMHHLLDELRSIEDHGESEAFELSPNATYNPLDQTRRSHTNYNGIAVLRNIKVPYQLYALSSECLTLESGCPLELLRVLSTINDMVTSEDGYATHISATLGVSPFSDQGTAWLQKARAAADRVVKAHAGIEIYIDGSAGIASDAVEAVYSSFPYMIAITTVVVFSLIGLFFQSCFHPLRSLVSISLTLAFAFGLSVVVFQNGVFKYASTSEHEFCWLVPVMGFSIIVGLALDYDVFLIYRILEYRLQGYEHRSSVALGLDSTGNIITAAGAIMALAFGSLMFSSNPVLYQWSFLVTTAVLFDTFVVRTIVVPILTGLAGAYCWWPRRLPDERACFEELRHQQPDDVAGLLRSLEISSEYEALDPLLEDQR